MTTGEQLRMKYEYWRERATELPWKCGIGNESKEVVAEGRGGLVAKVWNSADGRLIDAGLRLLDHLLTERTQLYVLEYTTPEEIEEVVGVYTSIELAKKAVPYLKELTWITVSEMYGTCNAFDSHGGTWFIYKETLNAPVNATFRAWEKKCEKN
jgi:hypothetical protein